MTPVERGTPLARAILRAVSAPDAEAADEAYQEAVGMADGATATAVARDHVADLLRRRAHLLALKRCTEHCENLPGDRILLLTRAEARCAVGDYRGAGQDADELGSFAAAGDRARLLRIRGLIAADRHDVVAAADLFDRAEKLFAAAGDTAGQAVIAHDRAMLGVLRGDQGAVAEVLAADPPRTPAERLLLAQALRRELRYERALSVLTEPTGTDPALLPALHEEMTDLRRLLRDDSDDEPLSSAGADPDSPRFDRRLQHVRAQVLEGRELLASRPAEAAVRTKQAEDALLELRACAVTAAEQAAWHLCAGEVELARGALLGRAGAPADEVDSAVHEAAAHLHGAERLADTVATAEVRVHALHLLGRARALLGNGEGAGALWRAAHRVEEEIAARQDTDPVKVRMLRAAGDEHDEQVMAAAELMDRDGPAAAAGVAVAIEDARGHTILDAVGGRWTPPRALGDVAGAYRQVRELTRDLPKSQVVWLAYPGPDRVHHVLLGRAGLRYVASKPRMSCRHRLVTAVETLRSFCTTVNLERSAVSGEFDEALTSIGAQLDVAAVVRALPPGVTRVAVVAQGVLAQVPMAALPVPGTPGRLIDRVAVSDLPSLSARRPLHHQALRNRGDRALLIRPEHSALTPAARRRRRGVLEIGEANLDRARDAVAGHRVVRVDSHGTFIQDEPWLELVPGVPGGRVTPADLRSWDLRRCGTLILGACDSGMARTTGRDEQTGFVRAAMHAGAAAVVAARWIAEDRVAGPLLDRFEHHARYLPRDVALRRAQLETPDHPTRWACWSLFGDAGLHTAAGPLRRRLRAAR